MRNSTQLIIVSACSSLIASLLLLTSLYIAAKRQAQAYAGDTTAGAKLILPVYKPLFQGLALLFFFLSLAQLVTIGFQSSNHEVYFYRLGYPGNLITTCAAGVLYFAIPLDNLSVSVHDFTDSPYSTLNFKESVYKDLR